MKNKFIIFLFICFLLTAVFYANKIIKQSIATNRVHHYMEQKGFPLNNIKDEEIHYSYSTDRWNLLVIMKDDLNFQYSFDYRFKTNDIQEDLLFLNMNYTKKPAKYNQSLYYEKKEY